MAKFIPPKRGADGVIAMSKAVSSMYDSIIKPEFKTFKVREGKNIIRILPPTWPGAKHYGLTIYVNYRIGADNQSYLSLSKMKNEADPLAEAKRQAQREGNRELAKQLEPTERVLMWIIDRSAEEEGPMPWAAPFTVARDFAKIACDEDTKEVIMVDGIGKQLGDEFEGHDIRFYRTGTGKTTKYDPLQMKILAASPVHEDPEIAMEWLQFIADHPLPSILNYYDYDHIAAAFDGQVARDQDDENGGEPASTKPAPAAARVKTTATPWEDPLADEEAAAKPVKQAEPVKESIADRLRKRRAALANQDED